MSGATGVGEPNPESKNVNPRLFLAGRYRAARRWWFYRPVSEAQMSGRQITMTIAMTMTMMMTETIMAGLGCGTSVRARARGLGSR
jgi:hypothetical protein